MKILKHLGMILVWVVIGYLSITYGLFFSIGFTCGAGTMVVFALSTIQVLDFLGLALVMLGVVGVITSLWLVKTSVKNIINHIKYIDFILKNKN